MNIQPLTDIKNRRDFYDAFEIAMSGADQSLRSRWQFGKDQNLPKSYLIEFHPKSNGDIEHVWDTEEVFKTLQTVGQAYGAHVQRTNDDSLLYLAHNELSGKYSAEFIVDCLNPRFLTFHTLSKVQSTDRFIFDRLTQYQPEFDSFWFPVSLLESVEKREKIAGWEASFKPLRDNEEVEASEETFVDEDKEVIRTEDELIESSEMLRMKVQRSNALKSYKQLKDYRIFPDVPLSSILAERYDNDLDTSARALIKSDGRTAAASLLLEELRLAAAEVI